MDFYKIGQQIRHFRKAQGLSQEELAEKIGISTTHMSHIETGNTKLSLSVFVDISNALNVQTDDLLDERSIVGTTRANRELSEVLNACSPEQLNIIADVVKVMINSIEKYSK